MRWLWSACLCGVLAATVAKDANGHADLSDRTSCRGRGADVSKTRTDTRARRRALRELMSTPVGGLYPELDAYIVPMDDEHQMEYIAETDRYVRFISGFSGSHGTAVLMAGGAQALWTDGRYYLQAERQLDCGWVLMKEDSGAPEISEWLSLQLFNVGSRVGADPRRMSALTWLKLKEKLNENNIELVLVEEDLISRLWTKDRPRERNANIEIHPLRYAGESWQEKVGRVREALEAASKPTQRVEALLVPTLDEVAWLLNIRGGAVPHIPVVKAYVVVDRDSVHLFVDNGKVTPEARRHLNVDNCVDSSGCVTLRRYEEAFSFVAEMCQSKWKDGLVWVPSRWSYAGGASYALYKEVPDEQRLIQTSPIIRMKAMKNPTEIAAMKSAHLRDSVALCDFLAMLETSVKAGKPWTELSVAARLREYRSQQALFKDTSFGTIAGFGPHGAIIHYKAEPETDARVDTSGTLLLDSGGQYLDGTTDVTRTMHYGQPSEFQREAYTRVLMGVIDLGSVVFVKGATDSRLDILARRPLYAIGLNYLHGTGHGIGLYLQVHEAPTQLRVYQKEEHLIEEGMFFSNEPGYYEAGQFGIRLETIMFAKEAENLPHNFSGPFLQFEAVTLAPFEPKMIKTELLTDPQLEWLNEYHQRVREEVGAMMLEQGRTDGHSWLLEKTKLLTRSRDNSCPAPGAAPDISGVWSVSWIVLLTVISIAVRLT